MGMRAEYEVRKLPPTFKTTERLAHTVEIKNGRRNRWGELPQQVVYEEGESTGGWIILVRGKPGHTIRIHSLDQARQHKLKVVGNEIVPRFIDDQTGEEVNERGIPLSVERQLAAAETARQNAENGQVETEIDVQSGASDDLLADEFDTEAEKFRNPSAGEAAISEQIAATE